jgi:superfamily II DNA or RNA helicase
MFVKMSVNILKNILKYKNERSYLQNLPLICDRDEKFYFNFEVYAKYFLLYDERLSYRVKNVYLFNEIPTNILKYLDLPPIDKGIDIIIETTDNTYIAVQVKYRSDINIVIPWSDLSTFEALTLRNDKFEYGILFSNTIHVCNDLLKNKKLVFYMYDTITSSNLFLSKIKEQLCLGLLNTVDTTSIKLRNYQKIAIKRTVDKFKDGQNKLKLIMAPGTGKTITSLRIYEQMLGLYVNSPEYDSECIDHTLIFICPYLTLTNQTFKEYFTHLRFDKSFFKVLCVASESEKNESIEHKLTTCIEEIEEFIILEGHLKIIFCTFASSKRVVKAVENTNRVMNLCFIDEAHKTVSNNQCYNLLECALIERILFMTGTEKIFNNVKDEFTKCMKNKELYGKYSYQYGLRKAIDQGFLVDYRIKIISSFESELEEQDILYLQELDQCANIDILNTCFILVDAFKKGEINKCVIFFNRKKEALIASQILEYLLNKEDISGVEVFNLSEGNRNNVLRDFKKSDRSIITNCFIMRLGLDICSIDSVCFYSDIESKIDIIQSIARSLRLYKNKEVATIILPIVLKDIEELETITKFENVRNVLLALSSNDEEMTKYISENSIKKSKNQRIIFEVCGVSKNNKEKSKEREHIIIEKINEINEKIQYNIYKSCEIGDILWNKQYLKLKKWLKINNQKYPKRNLKNLKEDEIGKWIILQRKTYKLKNLKKEKIKLLEKLVDWEWDFNDKQWMNKYLFVKNESEKNNKYLIDSGNKEKNIVRWIGIQRKLYKLNKLSKKRIILMKKLINWVWDSNINRENEWMEQYFLVENFIKKHKKYPSPKKLENNEEKEMGDWIEQRKREFKSNNISKEKIKLLEKLPNWKWNVLDGNWMEKYLLVKKYVEKNNEYPSQSKDKKVTNLGTWLLTQRENYKKNKIQKYRIDLLEKLPNWKWKIFDNIWMEKYISVKKYFEKNKKQPSRYSKEEKILATWLQFQKTRHKNNKLNKNQIDLLEKLPNWKWNNNNKNENDIWDENYLFVKKFIEEYNKYPSSKSKNKQEASSYMWIFRQRKKYKNNKLTQQKIEKLKLLKGFISWEN